MSFNADAFLEAKFKNRTAEVHVPELKKFFTEEEKPVWVVRGLTAEELARANDEVRQSTDIAAIVSSLASSVSKEKAEAVKDLIGISKTQAPQDIVKRISYLTSASVSPVCSRDLAIKLGNTFSVVFFNLTNKILELSGKGALGE